MTPLRRAYSIGPYLIVFAVGVFLYIAADNIDVEQGSGRIGPGAWPKLILVMMLATAAYGIASRLLKFGPAAAQTTATANSDVDEEDILHQTEIYPFRVWAAVVGTIAYVAALPVFGFFISTIFFSFGLMYLGSFRRILPTAGLSIAVALFFMFAFMRVVYVPLPLGAPPFDGLSYHLMSLIGVR